MGDANAGSRRDRGSPGSQGSLWPFSQSKLPGMKIQKGWSKNWEHDANDNAANGFRLLDREAPFGQSKGRWNTVHVASNSAGEARRLYFMDMFHTFLDAGNIWVHFLVYICVYVTAFLLFAPFYLHISDTCNLQLDKSFVKAYYLSMETMVTIGYGVPDPYYNGCWQGAILVTIQSILQFFLNALIIGAVFVRLTRPQNRANTILFSKHATIREHEGGLYFMFRICEMKYHDLIEAHVRCYAIRHDQGQTFQMLPMRLQQPDDDKGGMLLTALPNKVVHRIDGWSPLAPSWKDLQERRGGGRQKAVVEDSLGGRSLRAYSWPEVAQRQVDADQGNRDSYVCTTCGESFQTLYMLRRHCLYNSYQDPQNGLPEELCHKAWPEDAPISQSPKAYESSPHIHAGQAPTSTPSTSLSDSLAPPTRREIENFLTDRYIEVVVVVEGIEPTTSCTVQARHSYLLREEVRWDMDFADCMLPGTASRPCTVDLGRFHQIVPVKLEKYAELASPRSDCEP
jgi:potassium inwardly-rectifying channel subfamily J